MRKQISFLKVIDLFVSYPFYVAAFAYIADTLFFRVEPNFTFFWPFPEAVFTKF